MSEAAVKKIIRDPRELEVFKRAYAVSLLVHKATLDFPKIEQFALAQQLRNASKFICANIAEGFGKQTYSSAEFGRFLAIAEGSAIEVQIWLQYAQDLGYITPQAFISWDKEYLAIKSMLYKFRISL